MEQLDLLSRSQLARCGASIIGGVAEDLGSPHSNNCGFRMMGGIWSILRYNAELLAGSIKALSSMIGASVIDSDLDPSARLQGDVFIVDSVIEPFVVIKGPALLGPGTHVSPGSLVREGSVMYMGNTVGGEVKNSIIDENSTKPHFGYLGDSYVGRWVNLGAGSVTSNMKNTRGVVRYMGVDTGMVKLGAVIADWAKVGINTSIMGGRYVGQCSSVLGLIRENVPPFSSCINSQCSRYGFEKAVEIHSRFLGARGLSLDQRELNIMRHVFELSTTP
jgi:NDP-sugar pyrophosphorylase family protein